MHSAEGKRVAGTRPARTYSRLFPRGHTETLATMLSIQHGRLAPTENTLSLPQPPNSPEPPRCVRNSTLQSLENPSTGGNNMNCNLSLFTSEYT